MNYNLLDVTTWSRKNTFQFYKSFDDPFFNVTFNIRVSKLLEYCNTNKVSFFLSFIHACIKSANSVRNFRLRFYEDGVREYFTINGGSTVLYDDESFGFAYYDYHESLERFIIESSKVIEQAKRDKSFEPSADKEDLIYFSALPWISFTSIKHAGDSRINPGIPRISFGKYLNQDSGYIIPVNVEVNHALADGLHVGRFAEHLQKICDET